METAENLKNIINRQKEILADLEAEYKVLERSDLAQENTVLKAELEKLQLDFAKIRDRSAVLTGENASLKNALYEQIYNEKIRIVYTTAQKLDLYFKANIDGEINRLAMLEKNATTRIDSLQEMLRAYHDAAEDDIEVKLAELSDMLDRRMTLIRERIAQVPGAFTQEERDELEALKSEQITDEQIHAITKKNNLERFVGLNVLIAVGVFLLIMGAITLARFTYFMLPDTLKGIILFALGGVMLAAGEFMNRKKPTIFSLGISAGGIGILYAALAASHFGLHILTMYPAILLCVLITAGAIVLSNRYDSQTIVTFALIGGYLPIFSIDAIDAVRYGLMLYFIILNLLALLISFSKKWRISSFIGLALNTIGTLYISISFFGTDLVREKILTILYVLFAFCVYTAIPIISTYRTRSVFKGASGNSLLSDSSYIFSSGKAEEEGIPISGMPTDEERSQIEKGWRVRQNGVSRGAFTAPDIVLLAINTFFSSLIMFGVFYSFDLQDYDGLLAIAFAAIYLFTGRLIESKFPEGERRSRALFYLTGLAFVVLVIPLQFGRAWLSLGWLTEGVLLATYGVLHDEKRIRQAGFIIGYLCLAAFLVFDCAQMYEPLFAYKYLAITLGSLTILGAYMQQKLMAGLPVRIYKYIVLTNVWFYTMRLILVELWDALERAFGNRLLAQMDYLLGALAITATFSLAYAFSRIKLLSDFGTKILSVVLYILGILALFFMNTNMHSIFDDTYGYGFVITIVGTVVLFILGILSVLAMRDMMKLIVTERKLGIEWYPLIVSGYFVVLLTQNLITQYDLSFSSVIISILYVLAAFAWIIYGFIRRYSFIRKFGLGLAILAVIKLFLIDLADLAQGYQIVSYFILGLTLIAISYVYQYFNKRLELREGASVHADEE